LKENLERKIKKCHDELEAEKKKIRRPYVDGQEPGPVVLKIGGKHRKTRKNKTIKNKTRKRKTRRSRK
jgi:hypothetical protein